MLPELRATLVNRFRTPKGVTWAEVRVALRLNNSVEPSPSILVRFPYEASEELNNSPEELTEIIVKVAGDRLIELFRNAASELVREPLEARSPYVVLMPLAMR